MSTVTAVRISDWDKDGTIVKVSNVTFDDGREVPGYDLPPGIEEGKPLPDGWEIATAKSGKFYIKAPKPRGPGGAPQAAFRNTKEGQAAEQRSIHASVALGHAITLRPNGTTKDILKVADELLVWLQASSGAPLPAASTAAASAPAGGGARPHPAATTPSPPRPAPDEGGGMAQNRARAEGGSVSAPELELTGEGSTSSGAVCAHTDNSPLKPDGAALPRGFVRCLACGVVHKEGR